MEPDRAMFFGTGWGRAGGDGIRIVRPREEGLIWQREPITLKSRGGTVRDTPRKLLACGQSIQLTRGCDRHVGPSSGKSRGRLHSEV